MKRADRYALNQRLARLERDVEEIREGKAPTGPPRSFPVEFLDQVEQNRAMREGRVLDGWVYS